MVFTTNINAVVCLTDVLFLSEQNVWLILQLNRLSDSPETPSHRITGKTFDAKRIKTQDKLKNGQQTCIQNSI